MAGRRTTHDEGFDADFDHLYLLAYRVGFRVLQSRPDAEDVAQEVLTRAYVRWTKISDHAAPWVTRTAVNLSIDRARAASRRARREDRAGRADVPSGSAAGADPPDLELQAALLRLPKRQREAVVLRYFADLTDAAAADLLGVSAGTVKTHASRGVNALRASLGEP